MKSKFFLTSIFFLSLFVLAFSTVFAQTPSTQTQFPFTINGQDCNTKAECKVLCEDPVNAAACAALNPNASPRPDRFSDPAFVQAATDELGCSTAQSCKALCSLKINFEKCSQFAQKHQLAGGYDKRLVALNTQGDQSETTDPDLELLKEAEDQLAGGQTLEEFCGQEVNQKFCSLLAKRVGLSGGLKLDGPGGCQSAETCQAYCDDPANFSECKKFEIAGLNGCTSELTCYNELQSHPELLKNIVKNTEESSPSAQLTPEDLTQLAQTCATAVSEYQGKTAKELASDINSSGVCQILPKSGVPGKDSSCDLYLSSDQPFSEDTFAQECVVTPVVISQGLQKVDTKTAATDLTSYQNWCEALPSIGQSSDWQVVPSLCQNFVSTFQQAREACELPEASRPTWLQDAVAYSRYCLSAPLDTSDYAASCAADATDCQKGGFDWYCQQTDKTCVPLYQGRPLDQSVETFASAGLIKDGTKVSLVLDENTQDFAQGALAQTVGQLGTDTQFEVVSEVPENISKNASFVSGTGVGQGKQGNFRPTIFGLKLNNFDEKPRISLTPSTGGQNSTFGQPWYLLDARQQTNLSPMPTRTVDPNQPATGWNVVRQGEQELRRKYETELQTVQKDVKRVVEGILIPIKTELNIDLNIFKPQPTPLPGTIIRPTEMIQQAKPTTSTGTQVKEPTRIPTSAPSTGTNTGTNTGSTYKSPTPYPAPRTESGSTTGKEPTRAPNVPATQPTAPPPTQPPTGTNTGTGAGSGGTGTSAPPPSPAVQGAETEKNVFQIIWLNILNAFR